MINIYTLIFLMFSHWVSDFILQTDYMARGKSKTSLPLLLHILCYSIGMSIFAFTMLDEKAAFWFLIFNAYLHYIIDYYTSRISSKLHAENKIGSTTIPNFGMFTVIGFDQFLHFVSLVVTYMFLTTY